MGAGPVVAVWIAELVVADDQIAGAVRGLRLAEPVDDADIGPVELDRRYEVARTIADHLVGHVAEDRLLFGGQRRDLGGRRGQLGRGGASREHADAGREDGRTNTSEDVVEGVHG